MPWTNPITWLAGQVVGATDLNAQVRDNMSYLLSGRPTSKVVYAGSYSTTSGSFVDIDATNLIISPTLVGSRYIVLATMILTANNVANNYAAADIIVDSTTLAGGGSFGLTSVTTNSGFPVTMLGIFTGLSAGSHTFKLQWKAAGAGGTATNYLSALITAPPITMIGWEF